MDGSAVKVEEKRSDTEICGLGSLSLDLHWHIHRDDVLLQVNLGVQTCVTDKLNDPSFTFDWCKAKA